LDARRPAAEIQGQLDLLLDQAPLTAAWSVWGNEVGR
jgi:hypothetical protein